MFGEIVTESGKVLKSKDGPLEAKHDPEIERAGAQACVDGEVREAPESLSDAGRAAWLHGYDQVKAGQEGGAA
jgi:hypothetical protein